ncbi:hypothetical protein MRS44_008371 [Fusarium solani]|uniref:Major facilitator superfamily domain-containing protein n=1 Tax=Fusarium solani TaxID=169388 RepID=A0A9P9HXL8_FUSSL|nr:major facilitator superfamily domain-containing protein [Fusarium solani]KAH7265803.1 major facilitator superfamily domain-containing protein [Fusarium solani]KAJ3463585.1 hypothetical protein MRS44_008371 [Fusarium solani]
MTPQSSAVEQSAPLVALVSFANMFSVGTVYALSALQAELSRLLDTSHDWSCVPFASACLGLSIGVASCAAVMTKVGARTTAAAGTGLWGLAVAGTGISLARTDLMSLLACLTVGGIGVGWTYLAVVVLVGQAFPQHCRLRSAIGPLGFSSGSAVCFASVLILDAESLDAESLGRLLELVGVAFCVVGATTQAVLPTDKERCKPGNAERCQPKPSAVAFEDFLLFFNALPGMVVFSTLWRAASYHGQAFAGDALRVLPCFMVTLALGGFMAPVLAARPGPRLTFLALFYIRGASLLAFSQWPGLLTAAAALSVVLFGHGAGFGILPGLIKAKEPEPARFRVRYGRTLVAWGAGGIVSVVITRLLVSSSGDASSASFVTGLLVLSFAVYLQSANVLQ